MLIYRSNFSYDMLFTYDRGMICIGQKKFQKALELLYNVRHSIYFFYMYFFAIMDFCVVFNSFEVFFFFRLSLLQCIVSTP